MGDPQGGGVTDESPGIKAKGYTPAPPFSVLLNAVMDQSQSLRRAVSEAFEFGGGSDAVLAMLARQIDELRADIEALLDGAA